MENSSASYSNMKSDLYRVIADATHPNNKMLDDIHNTLTDIKNLLVEMTVTKGE